jgi:UDP-glucose 4-epimerase
MSKILLTGGAGYIGSHTAINFIENGNDIIIFDNFSSSNELVIKKLKVITKADIRFIKGDLRNLKDLQLLFEKNSFDSVVHFAGLKSPSDSLLNPIEYFNNNIIGSINLISVMSDFEVKKIIFSSSASVYGYSDTQPLKEKSSINPINPYSKSKQIVEELLMSLGSEWRIVILRYFNPAGAHSSGLIGEDPQGVPNNLMPYIQKVAKGE